MPQEWNVNLYSDKKLNTIKILIKLLLSIKIKIKSLHIHFATKSFPDAEK